MKLLTDTWQMPQFSLMCYPLQSMFIHYKSRIATAIRDLYWIKMTMVDYYDKLRLERLIIIILYSSVNNSIIFCEM